MGTLFTTCVDFRNDTASLVRLDRFFSRFAVGSHGFVASVMDESVVTGVLTFLVSNYTVAVWLAVDLMLALVPRNLSGLAAAFNAGNEARKKALEKGQLSAIRSGE